MGEALKTGGELEEIESRGVGGISGGAWRGFLIGRHRELEGREVEEEELEGSAGGGLGSRSVGVGLSFFRTDSRHESKRSVGKPRADTEDRTWSNSSFSAVSEFETVRARDCKQVKSCLFTWEG